MKTIIDIPEDKKFRGMIIAKICHDIVFLYDRNGKPIGDKHPKLSDAINRKMYRFYKLQKDILPEMTGFYLIGKIKKGEFQFKEAAIQTNDIIEFAKGYHLDAISKEVNIPLLK